MSSEPHVRSLTEADRVWAEALLDAELGGRMQARRCALVDVLAGPGLVAVLDDRPVGLVTWLADASGASAEIRVLAVAEAHRGVGTGRALMDAAAAALRAAGVRRAWLVTTNDNLAALALYEKAGWRLAALRPGAIDKARRTIKPAIARIGEHGIPLRDELELAIDL